MTRGTCFDLTKELGAFGAAATEILSLNAPNHRLINYLDLIPTPAKGNANGFPRPDAVIESDGSPLVYVLRADLLSQSPDLQRQQVHTLHKTLSCRGDAHYLSMVRPGEVTLFPLGLSKELPNAVSIKRTDPCAEALFRDLAMGLQPESAPRKVTERRSRPTRGEAVHDLLFRLLTRVTSELLDSSPLQGEYDAVLSLVGRALFTRFLIDRGIINEKTFPTLYAPKGRTPEQGFDTPDLAATTSEWLDDKFNGELLPLPDSDYRRYFRSLGTHNNVVFSVLSKILLRTTPEGQIHLDLGWYDIDFAHVPVGLLSQVYESYAHQFFEKIAKGESIVYTPRRIAEYIVEQSFPGITTSPPHEARILDPAAGAGVFLVLCFRKLVAERWKATGRRPDTRQIRAILNNQIRGFDINSSALKLAALSLYLTALELDPDPFPPTKLRFDKLMDNVLFHTRLPGEAYPIYPVLGSLGPAIGREHEGKYDLVIGNPPWTAWEGKGSDVVDQHVQRMILEIASKRGVVADSGRLDDDLNPDKVPDLPFVWRAMEWAKPAGTISFVLHGRLLFKHSGSGSRARDALFRALQVTGILNAAALTGHKDIWENMNQPFCLLFGRNTVPRPEDLFNFVSPEREEGVNRQSRIRVDYQSAQPIQFSVLSEKPSLLKILYTGTSLDMDVIEKISRSQAGERPMVRLGKYWIPSSNLSSGQGYREDTLGKQYDATFLIEIGAKVLSKNNKMGFLVHAEGLPEFTSDTLNRPRCKEKYLPPLVLISQAPGDNRKLIRARLALEPTPIAFTESYYGYSSHKHPRSEEIARYLFVLANSDLFIYHLLMTSSKFGVERRAILEDDIADFPIVPFENLSPEQLRQVARISAQLVSPTTATWNSLNEFVSTLYGLFKPDREVISDTLRTRMPYAAVRRTAEARPNQGQVEEFRSRLEDVMRPFFDLTHENIGVNIREKQPSRTWLFLDVISSSCKSTSADVDLMARLAEVLAERTGSSRIMIPVAEGHLCIGILAQYRYWTRTRARLCALDILREHGKVFRVRTQ